MKIIGTKAVIYGTSLLLSVSASIWVAAQEGRRPDGLRVVEASRRPSQESPVSPSSAHLALPVREFPETSMIESSVNVFGVDTPAQPPAAASIPAPAAETQHQSVPVMPNLPFEYRGMVRDADGNWLVQLASGREYFVAGPGDVLASNYRLEKRSDETLTFTYLPLSKLQFLSTLPAGK